MTTKLDYINSRTIIIKKVDRLGTRVEGHERNPLSLGGIVGNLQDLDTWSTKADDLHDRIRPLCKTEEEVEIEDDAALDLCESISEVRGMLLQLQLDINKPSNIPAAAGGTGGGDPTHTGNATSEVRLPRIEVPTFAGDYIKWTSFHDLYSSIIHNNTKLSRSQKFHYLRQALQGEAAEVIRSLPLSDANYDEAWSLLVKRYDDKRHVIKIHLDSLLDLKPLHQQSATDLRSLIDTSREQVRALRSLAADNWNAVLVHVLVSRLDPETRKDWSLKQADNVVPTYEELDEFMEKRCRALLESIGSKPQHPLKVNLRPQPRQHHYGKPSPGPRSATTHHVSAAGNPSSKTGPGTKRETSSSPPKCPQCQDVHHLYQCQAFLNTAVGARRELVRRNRLCYNCLSSSHGFAHCFSNSTCKICSSKHHTLLHEEKENLKTTSDSAQVNHLAACSYTSLMPTAVIDVCDAFGQKRQCRLLLDTGSQVSLITESCVRMLGLRRSRGAVPIVGISEQGSGTTRGSIKADLISRVFNFRVRATLLIMPRLTGKMPGSVISGAEWWPHRKCTELADPTFFTPGPVDIIIGVDLYDSILVHGPGTFRSFRHKPPLRKSQFGWLVRGPVRVPTTPSQSINLCTIDVQQQLARFWELEELQSAPVRAPEDIECEDHFMRTHQRQPDGRYVVSLPFKNISHQLGHSRQQAVRRLLQVERRLAKLPEHRESYNKFMEEFLRLGHMELVPGDELIKDHLLHGQPYYLPHHFVEKKSSSSTKLRVVFDGSAKTSACPDSSAVMPCQPSDPIHCQSSGPKSTGASLNELLMVGPRLQNEIVDILIRFRLYKFVFIADIEKFFRQVRISQQDADYQRIVWRSSPKDPIKDYRLTTVTYGTASAPFLASRALLQLAKDEGENYPHARNVIERDFYVDDVITGEHDLESTLELQSQLVQVLSAGQFPLVKWSANCHAVLEAIAPSQRETQLPLSLDKDDSIKALGLFWNPGTDNFFFKVTLPPASSQVTKRTLLSDTSRLYDPLGWLSPVVFRAKVMFQELWKKNLGWDDELSPDLASHWLQYRGQLQQLEEIQISRHVINHSESTHELHGFCDASQVGYAAVIYLRSQDSDGQVMVNLLCSKTKVAPVKTVSIPRLELCSATLLARLITRVHRILTIDIAASHAWTDSKDVLAWIARSPHHWKTFVANRVSEIQTLTGSSVTWHHVPGKQNPADCASRGLAPPDLAAHELWWTGPAWLTCDLVHWPRITQEDLPTDLPEQRPAKVFVTTTDHELDLVSLYSSLEKLKRVTAYCFRFIFNLRHSEDRRIGCLTPLELHHALLYWVRLVQHKEFANIFRLSESKGTLPPAFAALNPFVDANGLLRVGGRLTESDLDYGHRHPLLLPQKHCLTDLIIQDAHLQLLHGGGQLMMASIRAQFWIINMRKAVRRCIYKCVICTRLRATTMEQQMGSLPSSRVRPARAFLITGVDYGGPFAVKAWKGRGAKQHKAYIALFICFSTKAIHIEVVSDLTTDTFVAALRRFIARRGKPTEMRSDHGTNFVGADRVLQSLLQSDELRTAAADFCSTQGIKWAFIPPGAPHHGGLWEAGIKSAKAHMRKIIGHHTLTFEELTTVMHQIEAALNSRPITSLSSDPNDLEALTPGHFLVGHPLVAAPDPDLSHLPENHLNRWQLVQQLSQQFWRRWRNEYLAELQQRTKWTAEEENIAVGDLVLVKEDNLPPLSWARARVVEVHPAKDGKVRVVTLRVVTGPGFKTSTLQRDVRKLCKLPVDV